MLGVGGIDGVREDVIPGVELVDIVSFFKVARAELKGLRALEVVRRGMRAVGRNVVGCGVRCNVLDCVKY